MMRAARNTATSAFVVVPAATFSVRRHTIATQPTTGRVLHSADYRLQGGARMREAVRPVLKLAVFGTYTLLAISIAELRGQLRKVGVQAKQRSRAWRSAVR